MISRHFHIIRSAVEMAPISDDPDNVSQDDASSSLAQRRSKRAVSSKKNSRLAALERLKEAKRGSGSKFKYELEDMQNVYDEVDEDEYSKVVRDRQDDDWIVDDDGAGYVEDGREIFDDDLYGDDEKAAGKGKKGKESTAPKDSKKLNVKKPSVSKSHDIKSMFKMGASKQRKPEKEVSLADDELLGDILTDLHNDKQDVFKPLPIKKKVRTSGSGPSPSTNRNPFSKTPTRPHPSTSQPRSVDYDMSSLAIPKQRPQSRQTIVKREMDPETEEPAKRHKRSEVVIKEEPKDEIEEFSEMSEDQGHGFENMDFDNNEIDNFDSEDISQATVKEEVNTRQEPEVNDKGRAQKPNVHPDVCSSSGWETIREEAEDKDEVATDIQVDCSSLPMTTNDSGDQVLRFFWMDAYEDPYHQPEPGQPASDDELSVESMPCDVQLAASGLELNRPTDTSPTSSKQHSPSSLNSLSASQASHHTKNEPRNLSGFKEQKPLDLDQIFRGMKQIIVDNIQEMQNQTRRNDAAQRAFMEEMRSEMTSIRQRQDSILDGQKALLDNIRQLQLGSRFASPVSMPADCPTGISNLASALKAGQVSQHVTLRFNTLPAATVQSTVSKPSESIHSIGSAPTCTVNSQMPLLATEAVGGNSKKLSLKSDYGYDPKPSSTSIPVDLYKSECQNESPSKESVNQSTSIPSTDSNDFPSASSLIPPPSTAIPPPSTAIPPPSTAISQTGNVSGSSSVPLEVAPVCVLAAQRGMFLLGGVEGMVRSISKYEDHLWSSWLRSGDDTAKACRSLCTTLLKSEFSKHELATRNLTGRSKDPLMQNIDFPKLDEVILRAIFSQAKLQFPGFKDSYEDPSCATVQLLNNICRRVRANERK